jgi:transposase InsO family protein
MRKADGETTEKALEAYCMRYGYPRVIHSDGGPHFFNKKVLQWSEDNGIKWVFGASRVGKSQGKAKRSIQSWKSTIQKVVDEKKDWVKVVTQA